MNIRIIIYLISLHTFLMHFTVAKDNKLEADGKKRPGSGSLSGQGGLLGGQNFLNLFSGQSLLSSFGGQGSLSNLFGSQGLISSFAHSRLNEVMSAATGVLAAIGGGYLLYVATVALYGNVLGRPYGLRESSDLFRQVRGLDYPEAVFNWLQIKDESCRMKAVCELQAYLSGSIVPSAVLEGISKRIPGMEKYLAASRRGLRKQSCQTQCRLSTGEMMIKAMGSWFNLS